jgi:hypothetical protein
MREYARIKTSEDTIATFHQNAMFPGLDKVVIKYNLPLRMHEFTVTKRHECVTGRILPSCLVGCKFFESIWKLLTNQQVSLQRKLRDLLKIGYMVRQATRWFAPPIFGFIAKEEIQGP